MDRSQGLQLRERIQQLVPPTWLKDWRTTSLFTAILSLALLGSLRKMFSFTTTRQKPDVSEPGLFKKLSTFSSFTIASGHIYPKIRVFYSPHAQAAKLPKDLPLLVFIHGLGGNATQFAPLLTSMVNVAPCLAIDLPGCGQSNFKPDEPAAYTTSAFAELVCAAIEKYRVVESNQQVVLVGHSMGCSIAALLASSTSPLREKLKAEDYVIGMIALNPRSGPFTTGEARTVGQLKYLPVAAFDLIRMWDRRGGLNGASITRMVGEGADAETRKLQQRFNEQSKSAVFLRFVAGMMPGAAGSEVGLPGEKVWSGVKVPLFLVAGEADKVTSPKEVEKIAGWLTKHTSKNGKNAGAETSGDKQRHEEEEDVAPDVEPRSSSTTTAPIPTTAGDVQLAQFHLSGSDSTNHGPTADPPEVNGVPIKDNHHQTRHAFALKTTIFPSPASHGLMYSTSTIRILSGLIETFLAHHVDERLSLGWQLQHLTTSGKWDVKNLSKWSAIAPCSEPIGKPVPVFRAMKTMREVDESHNPKEFVKRFGAGALPDAVAMVVDISHESPVYDPKGLEEGGVEYHKFPTVSKLPPTADEVAHFISLIDHLRTSPKLQPKEGENTRPLIGIHCHYGFNRTGFFIICYLVERLHYRLQDAIQEFAEKRAPGIKHEHFVNELFVRYAAEVGKMERRGTIVG